MPAGVSDAQIDELLRRLALASSVRDACAFAGIGEHNVYHWLRWGREGRSDYWVHLAGRINRARAEATEAAKEKLRQSHDWRAQLALLARLDSNSWGEHVAAGTAPDPERVLDDAIKLANRTVELAIGFFTPEQAGEFRMALEKMLEEEAARDGADAEREEPGGDDATQPPPGPDAVP